MHLNLDDEQLMLRDSIARFARDSGGAAPGAVAEGLAGLGLWAMAVPEAAGGLGGRGRDLMVMMEAAGHGLLPAPLAVSLAALDLLARHGTGEQRAEWLGPAMEGTARLAFAQAGDGPRAEGGGPRPFTRLEGPRLSGQLPLVPGADTADALMLVVGRRAHIVPLDAPGVRRQALRMADGTGAARLALEEVAADPLPASAGQIEDSLARASAAACAQMLGVMERMLADTLDHVKTRRQFGTAIGSFQTIQHRMARLYVSVGLCRSVVLTAAEGWDCGETGNGQRKLGGAGDLRGRPQAEGEDGPHREAGGRGEREASEGGMLGDRPGRASAVVETGSQLWAADDGGIRHNGPGEAGGSHLRDVANGDLRRDWLRHVAAAQALVSEQALHLAHECVQFHGGMGITAELAVSRGHRQLMVLSRLFGPPSGARSTFARLAG